MVLFVNVVVGQFVEVKHRNHIVCGTVRYKGHLNGVLGEWVGVELEYPLGDHNGTWRGRHYFKSRSNCGVFTHASNIRFHKRSRTSRNKYHKIGGNSTVDESLFFAEQVDYSDCYSISANYARLAKTSFSNLDSDDRGWFQREKRYPLLHLVGQSVPTATMLKPNFSQISYNTTPVYSQYDDSDCDFSTKPTIPFYTMPHQALKRQLRRGSWEAFGLTQPRYMSV